MLSGNCLKTIQGGECKGVKAELSCFLDLCIFDSMPNLCVCVTRYALVKRAYNV